MKRQRVRRSFTVEVKSRNRATPSPIITATASPPRPASLWAETSLTEEMSRQTERDEPSLPAAASVAAPDGPSRRILPNLMAPEPAALEKDDAAASKGLSEPRLPRVRRVAQRVTKPQVFVAPVEPVIVVAPAPAASPPARTARREAQATPSSRAGRKAAPVLRAGERWKRRLPKSLW